MADRSPTRGLERSDDARAQGPDVRRQGGAVARLHGHHGLAGEPGRALVAHSISVVTQVQLRKDDQLYINDGVYGSLSEMVDAGLRLPARAHRLNGPLTGAPKDFILNGPTCDSLDVLPSTFSLPSDIDEGDWIEIDRVGAYSNALATRFNGFTPETLVVVHDQSIGSVR